MNDIILSTQNGEPVASSRDVAKRFGKEHKDVLRAIKSITAQNCAVTQMFYQSEYTAGTGKKYPMYLMNRDGFSLLAMGFTGKEAVQWKLKYIEAFNQMERSWTRTPLFWTSAARTARTARPSTCRSKRCLGRPKLFTVCTATMYVPWKAWYAAPRAT